MTMLTILTRTFTRKLLICGFVSAAVMTFAPSRLAGQDGTQLSQAQQDMIKVELTKRGLTEQEVRARLTQEGIVLEAIPMAELPAYRGRIIAILDKMVAEKKAAVVASVTTVPKQAAMPGAIPTALPAGAMPTVVADSAKASATATPTSTVAEVAADAQAKVTAQHAELSDIYGHNIFANKTLEVFRTTDGARAPDTYVLGGGDQLRVGIFGVSQADLLLEVNLDGYVQVEGIPKIFLQGLTLAQARTLLQARLAAFYTFNANQIAITIQTARTLTVNVFGESEVRGSFSVSALNTAFNALVAAGGPTRIGSVRDIQVIRGATRRRMDVYQFMTDPSILFRFDLQHNDVLFVPIAKTVVKIEGAVKRPMRYELVDGEDLKDLIRFAGGVNYDTYPDFVQVERVQGDSLVLREWRLGDVLAGKVKVPLGDGDVVRIRQIGRALEQFVDVEGAVFYEGKYDLGRNPTLKDLLSRAQLRPSAADIAYVFRTNQLNRAQIDYLKVDVRRDLAFSLGAGDKLVVYDRRTYSDVGQLTLGGAVHNPIRTEFDPALGLSDLLTMAGGLTRSAALNRVDLFRLNVSGKEGTTFDRIQIQIDSQFRIVAGPLGFRLQPFDQVVVRAIPLFDASRAVELSGQVMYPGTYALSNQLTYLSEIVALAGGLTNLADPMFATLVRSAGGTGPVGVDLSAAMQHKRDPQVDPILVEGDKITIPRRLNTVAIRLRATRVGELTATGAATTNMSEATIASFVDQGRRSADWYIREFAGGFAQKADKGSVTVTDPNGRVRGTKRSWIFFRDYPTVLPGSTISLRYQFETPPDQKKDPIDWEKVSARAMQTITALLSLVILKKSL